MEKHSPGPWTLALGAFVEVRAANGDPIVASCGCARIENPADARLIAAAPEMLEMLERAAADARKLGLAPEEIEWLVERVKGKP